MLAKPGRMPPRIGETAEYAKLKPQNMTPQATPSAEPTAISTGRQRSEAATPGEDNEDDDEEDEDGRLDLLDMLMGLRSLALRTVMPRRPCDIRLQGT